MRIPHYLTRTKSGFNFRCRVPRDLQEQMARKVIKRTLRTHDQRIAQAAAMLLASRYSRDFDRMRKRQGGKGMETPTLDAVQAMYEQCLDQARTEEIQAALRPQGRTGTFKQLEVGMGPAGPFLKTETGDSPEVIARALELVERMMGLPLTANGTLADTASIASAPAISRITAKDGAKRFLAAIKSGTKPKTYTIKQSAVEGFVAHFTKQDPKRIVADARRVDVAEWVAALRNDELSTPTITNKLSYLRGYFKFLMGAGFYPDGDNPAVGHVTYGKREQRLRRKHGFRALTFAEISAIFAPAALEQLNPEARWGALIGLYTGARVAEVGQLAVADFKSDAEIPLYRFTDQGKGQSLKNVHSERVIPIHDDLITLGILDRLQTVRDAKDLRFFPNVEIEGVNGAGNWLSKAFSAHLKSLGIVSEEDGPKVGFHSLRKAVVQAMQDRLTSAEIRAQYVGHELEDIHRTIYSRLYSPAELKETVFPALAFGLDLAGIRAILGAPKRRRRKA